MTQIRCLTLSRNQGKFLRAAVESVSEQAGPVDYLVYDVGSTDNSLDILNSLQCEKFRVMEVESDDGPADGLNVGLRHVEGEIFYYLNADDRVLPGAFDFARSYFEKHPTCDVLHGSIVLIDEAGNSYKTLPAIKFSLRAFALRYSVVYQQATFIRSRALGPNPFNVNNRTSWDGELIADLALQGRSIQRTLVILGEFRIHSSSITGSNRYEREIILDHRRIFKRITDRDWNCWDSAQSWFLRKLFASLRRLFIRAKFLPGQKF